MRNVIIVTGASRGIGREIAKVLAKQGNIIVANYNKSEEAAKDLKQELQRDGIEIDIFKADISKRHEVNKMVEFTLKKYKHIDILINNAGIAQTKLFTDVTDDDWQIMINNNLYSAFCMTQEVLPNMIHNKRGSIINISSVYGIVGASCESIYSITKAGMNAMTKSLAKELGPSNIRVNSIAPGPIYTDMNNNLTPNDIIQLKNEIPLGKIGNTLDIAKCVKWLVEDEFTTGQVISIDGGWTIT